MPSIVWLATTACLIGEAPETAQEAAPLLENGGGSEPYYASNTNSAQQNSVIHYHTLTAGQTLKVDTCFDSYGFGGNSFVRLYQTGAIWWPQLAQDNCSTPCGGGGDDTCFSFTAPWTMNVATLAGCYGSTECTADYRWSIAPLDSVGMLTNVQASFDAINNNGSRIAFKDNGLMPGLSGSIHIQGIVRLPRSLGFPFDFVLDSSRDSSVYFVRFGNTAAAQNVPVSDSAVELDDRVLVRLSNITNDASLTHGGGIAAAGQFVLVPFEQDNSVSPKTKSEIIAIDASVDPPVIRWKWSRTSEATAIGVTKTSNNAPWIVNNRHVLAVWEINNHKVRFYTKPQTSRAFSDIGEITAKPWSLLMSWDSAGGHERYTLLGTDNIWGDYQNISLLAQHEGQIFLVASNTADSTGENIADMWQLKFGGDSVRRANGTWTTCGSTVCLQKTGREVMNMAANTSSSLDWGAGPYIWSTGSTSTDKLFFYATDKHNNDDGNSNVRMSQF